MVSVRVAADLGNSLVPDQVLGAATNKANIVASTQDSVDNAVRAAKELLAVRHRESQ